MADRPRSAAVALTLIALALVASAAGCKSESPHREADLARIDDWLPGRYDNQAQIAEDRRAGRPPHEALALSVVPIDALQMGHHVFYIEETAGRAEPPGKGPRRILAQRLGTIDIVNGQIVAGLWSFTDPPRWREGGTTPELFSSLQPPDVKAMRGCGLVWMREDAKFTAADDPSLCRTVSPVTGGVESLTIRVELTRDELAVSVRAAPDAESGAAASAADGGDSFIRFRRSGGP
jgi:hypothetical protein